MPTTLTSKSAAEMFVSSGGANGTRVSPLGFIEPAVAPRLDYDPVTKAAKGLLIESGRTNMLRYASRFDQTTGWSVQVAGGTPHVKVVPNATLAPNGHMEAAKLILSSQSNYGNGRVAQAVTKAAAVGTYVASVYLKSAGATGIHLRLRHRRYELDQREFRPAGQHAFVVQDWHFLDRLHIGHRCWKWVAPLRSGLHFRRYDRDYLRSLSERRLHGRWRRCQRRVRLGRPVGSGHIRNLVHPQCGHGDRACLDRFVLRREGLCPVRGRRRRPA